MRVLILLFGLCALLSACAAVPASRGGGDPLLTPKVAPALAALGPVELAAIRVTVPDALKISEENRLYPRADIVWHGEAEGDRRAQVARIFEDAAAPYIGAGQVVAEIEVEKFHALSPVTRNTIGGRHEMRFNLTLVDATTGAVVAGPVHLVADTTAAGGKRAREEEARGLTQRVVVVSRLRSVLGAELGIGQPVVAQGPAEPALLAQAADPPIASRSAFDPRALTALY